MKIKIYYKVTYPLQYNFVDADSIKLDGKCYKEQTSFNDKSLLTFLRKGRELNFELFDIQALNFKIDASSYILTNINCNVLLRQNIKLVN